MMAGPAMDPNKQLDEANFILAEVDNLIASTEARIERQQNTARMQTGDHDGSSAASAELEMMKAALEKLKSYQARITPENEEPSR
jgi:hypothetical protein